MNLYYLMLKIVTYKEFEYIQEYANYSRDWLSLRDKEWNMQKWEPPIITNM